MAQNSSGREGKDRNQALGADGQERWNSIHVDDQQGAAISGTTLRDCQASRRGCEGIIGFNEIIRKNYEIYTPKESID